MSRSALVIVFVLFLLIFLWAQEATFQKFRNLAKEIGVEDVPAYRVFLSDIDGDFFDDLIVQINDEKGPVNPGGVARLFINTADSLTTGGRKFVELKEAFSNITDGKRESASRNTGVFVIVGDVNNDGIADIFRACYQEQPDHKEFPDTGERSAIVLGKRTSGRVAFEVVSGSGVAKDGPVTTCGAAFLDYDRDGNLDLFVGNWYVRFGTNLLAHPDRLYRGDGKGKFKDVT
ncbi:MAG: hypothetical protein N2234_04640, partial [Planctomycetota bacterium]|nr:hypothetical protein [Planctomycetota bacterium]